MNYNYESSNFLILSGHVQKQSVINKQLIKTMPCSTPYRINVFVYNIQHIFILMSFVNKIYCNNGGSSLGINLTPQKNLSVKLMRLTISAPTTGHKHQLNNFLKDSVSFQQLTYFKNKIQPFQPSFKICKDITLETARDMDKKSLRL